MKDKVSLKIIAEETGFSVSTVSRVMNGHAEEFRISEKTEKLILGTIKKYDYKPNPIAVNLRVKKSFTVGLVIPSLENPFFVKVTSILNRKLTTKDYNIILTESDDDPKKEGEIIRRLMDRNIDALLLIPCKDHTKNLSLLEKKYKEGVPIICIDRYFKKSIIPYITTDNEKGAYEGVKYLIEKGHRKIACIQGLKKSSTCIDRKKGYLKALKEQNLEPFYIGGDEFTMECGYRETEILLKEKDLPTAIFAMSSTIALGVMKAIKKKGFNIPDDISLMGFDNNIFLDYLSTPLTTIAQPVKEISETAVKSLIDHLDDKVHLSSGSGVMLDTKLIHRKSVEKLDKFSF